MIAELRCQAAGLLVLFVGALSPLNVHAQGFSFDELKSELGYVLELIAKRPLSDAEIERAAREYHGLFDHICDQRCVEAVAFNKRLVEPMEAQPGSPRDLLSRQWLSRQLYFSPTQAGSFIQSLANEVDPVRLADAKSGRIMTQNDVLGLLNINQFLREGGKPLEQTFEASEIDNLVAAFHQDYIQGPVSLPYRATLAAELWAGLHQNWASLEKAQQDAVVAYLSDRDFRTSLDISSYQNLLGLSEEEAIVYRNDNQAAQRNARLEWLTQRSLGIAEAASNVRASGSYCYFCR